MKQGYKFLAKHFPFILCCSLATTAAGVVAMKLGYNITTSWLKLTGVCTIAFALLLAFTVGYEIFISIKVPDIHLARIKKKCAFLKIAAVVSFMMIFFMFSLETYKLVLASYEEKIPEYFTVWRVLKYIFALPASAHFLLMALPSKFKRKKKVNIPRVIRYITSAGAIFWSIFGLLSAYFYSQLSIKNVLKIWQLIVYLAFLIFFLFETKFDNLNNGKATARGFIFTSSLAFTLACAFSLTTLICMIFRIIPVESNITFSATEILTSFAVGLYALSKLFAYMRTAKVVAYNHNYSSSSSRFDKTHQASKSTVTSSVDVASSNTTDSNQ